MLPRTHQTLCRTARVSYKSERMHHAIDARMFFFFAGFTDEQIRAQAQYCIDNGWAVNIEFTDDPHPRNTYWEMWGLPMFDIKDAAAVMMELRECRKAYGDRYIRLSDIDSNTWMGVGEDFLPRESPGGSGIRRRGKKAGRNMRYTTQPT